MDFLVIRMHTKFLVNFVTGAKICKIYNSYQVYTHANIKNKHLLSGKGIFFQKLQKGPLICS